jgi:hypothetical protein
MTLMDYDCDCDCLPYGASQHHAGNQTTPSPTPQIISSVLTCGPLGPLDLLLRRGVGVGLWGDWLLALSVEQGHGGVMVDEKVEELTMSKR